MFKKIKLKNNKLYISKNLYTQDSSYKYIDQIGIFAKKYPLKLDSEKRYTVIDLDENFSSDITEEKTIEFNLNNEYTYRETVNHVNNLYDIDIYTNQNHLYIKLKNKSDSDVCHMNSNATHMSYFLAKVINSHSKHFTELYELTGFNRSNVKEMIDIIYKESIINQDWKLFVKFNDDQRNMSWIEADLKPLILNNKVAFDQKEMTFLENDNCISYKNLVNESIKSITFNKAYFEIEFNENIEDQNLFIAKRERTVQLLNFKSFKEIKIPNDSDKVKVMYEDIAFDWIKNGDNIEILIGKNIQSSKFLTLNEDTTLPNNYFTINNRLDCKFYKNGRDSISIYIKEKTKDNNLNTTKIAVLGTCFSRNAFNTTDYFNPNYKELVNCVYTQFHSTVESLISPEKAPRELLDMYINNADIKYINTDFNKSFFEELAESGAEYLIIDLYADAMLNQLTLCNDSIITYNYMIKENVELGKYVVNWGDDKYINEKAYIEQWVKSLKIFMNQLINIIPENKIILNRGRLTKTYYEGEAIKQFGTINVINRNNYYWELLDNTFIKHFPEVNVIDITDRPYHADKNYPFGFSYSHYESEYYQTFFNELVKILYKNKLSLG
nr:DUF6270 domain-containing protein [Mammaliicoccus sp. Marseille-Q6498]